MLFSQDIPPILFQVKKRDRLGSTEFWYYTVLTVLVKVAPSSSLPSEAAFLHFLRGWEAWEGPGQKWMLPKWTSIWESFMLPKWTSIWEAFMHPNWTSIWEHSCFKKNSVVLFFEKVQHTQDHCSWSQGVLKPPFTSMQGCILIGSEQFLMSIWKAFMCPKWTVWFCFQQVQHTQDHCFWSQGVLKPPLTSMQSSMLPKWKSIWETFMPPKWMSIWDAFMFPKNGHPFWIVLHPKWTSIWESFMPPKWTSIWESFMLPKWTSIWEAFIYPNRTLIWEHSCFPNEQSGSFFFEKVKHTRDHCSLSQGVLKLACKAVFWKEVNNFWFGKRSCVQNGQWSSVFWKGTTHSGPL